jgi:hypothetical protein
MAIGDPRPGQRRRDRIPKLGRDIGEIDAHSPSSPRWRSASP